MGKVSIRIFIFIFGLACINLSAGDIKITYPYEGLSIPPVKNTFVFGNINPSTGTLHINGQKIEVYKNGGFIAFLPVSVGEFAFNCELFDGFSTNYFSRSIEVRESKMAKLSTSTLHLEIISPSANMRLRAGDWITVNALATPFKEASFSIKGLTKDGQMLELPEGSGKYYGSYYIKVNDEAENEEVMVTIRGGKVKGKMRLYSEGKITIDNGLNVVEVSTDTAVLKNGIRGGYMMFPPMGVKMTVDGKIDSMYRIRLSDSDSAWIHKSKISLSPKNSRPPDTETSNIKIFKTDKGSMAKIAIWDKVPYMVTEAEKSLTLRLYYTKLHSNWVVYDSLDTFTKNVNFKQAGTNVAEINFEFNRKIWGYDIHYSERNELIIEFKEPPSISRKWPKPLKGLNIVLDPGHSAKREPPYDGAIGPMGIFEYEANLWLAERLKEDFEKLGANIIMTRIGDEDVPLRERPKIAKKSGGDIFISVHYNAIGDGANPFARPRGHSLYYYHRHSSEFARAVHKLYNKNIELPDEGARFGDYHVLRQTYMPAILLESAYMIYPEQEEMSASPAFRKKLSATIVKGTLNFLEVGKKPKRKYRKRRKKSRGMKK
ncbi:MAG: N-acetylmuramoyl-L-alanine amidase [Elusimicrobiota bacterium]|nr:N-acetylmuramoyl-L-alanine amidase [Elusimicrobiota bacterium]